MTGGNTSETCKRSAFNAITHVVAWVRLGSGVVSKLLAHKSGISGKYRSFGGDLETVPYSEVSLGLLLANGITNR